MRLCVCVCVCVCVSMCVCASALPLFLQVMNGHFVHYFAPKDLPVVPKNVVFVIDTSASMLGTKIRQVRRSGGRGCSLVATVTRLLWRSPGEHLSADGGVHRQASLIAT